MLLAKKFGQKTSSEVTNYQLVTRAYSAYTRVPTLSEKITNYSATAKVLKTSTNLDKPPTGGEIPPPIPNATNKNLSGMSSFIGNSSMMAREFQNRAFQNIGNPATVQSEFSKNIKGASIPGADGIITPQTVPGVPTISSGPQSPQISGNSTIASSNIHHTAPHDPAEANSTQGPTPGGGRTSTTNKTVGYPNSNPTGAPLIKNPGFISPQNIFTSKLNIVSR